MADALFIDKAAAAEAYERVRGDDNQDTWLVSKYEGKQVGLPVIGTDYDHFLDQLGDDDRAYCYVRFETGEEMTRRAKYALVTWIGSSVSPLDKAHTSTDKEFVKAVMPQFGKEMLVDEKGDLEFEKIQAILEKASGAAYGTGK